MPYNGYPMFVDVKHYTTSPIYNPKHTKLNGYKKK